MSFFVLSCAMMLLGGISALLPLPHWRRNAAPALVAVGALLGLVPTLAVLTGGARLSLYRPWPLPGAALALEIDPLSAFFLLPVFVLVSLGAVYGRGYLRHVADGGRLGFHWCMYGLLGACLALVLAARNAVLFLMAWEALTLASFFLVTLEDEDATVRSAGWLYLVAAHVGTACLLALFLLLGRRAGGSLDFAAFAGARGVGPAGALFILALLGFGLKAGFLPLHVWLPEAHPAAPSHVSALMSGVMIKTGIYGLLRTLTLLEPAPAWWGWVLLGVGFTSGVGGVLFALTQQDLKRLLAYSSIENVGIIALGLGLGLLGLAAGEPGVAGLALAGALAHVLNHALGKSLLFFATGAIAQATGTRRLEELGGLLRRLPRTGTAFLGGALALAGLPPLNGFVGEFLIGLAAWCALAGSSRALLLPAVTTITGLALIGGLGAACFARAAGIALLGEPRSAGAQAACELPRALWLPPWLLLAACAALAALAPVLVPFLAPVLADLGPLGTAVPALPAWAATALGGLAALSALLLLLAAWFWLSTARRLRRAGCATVGTWDCGYVRPTSRMQYTAASLAQPLVDLFRAVLQPRREIRPPTGLFPTAAAFRADTRDVIRHAWLQPAAELLEERLARLRWLQHGRLHLYVLYIAVTILVLLIVSL